MNKIIICGTKHKDDYILRYKGSNTYHRVPANSLLEAKAKMLKGTRYNFNEIEEMARPKNTFAKGVQKRFSNGKKVSDKLRKDIKW